jgi:hypothetical protein
MITYKNREVSKVGTVVDVFLEKRKVGTIYRVMGGYQYQISKNNVGQIYPTLTQVKQSLESE